jgi:hypothetical protein
MNSIALFAVMFFRSVNGCVLEGRDCRRYVLRFFRIYQNTRRHISRQSYLLDFDSFGVVTFNDAASEAQTWPALLTVSTQKCPSEKQNAFNPIISDLVATSHVALILYIVTIMMRWTACTCWQALLFAAVWLEILSVGLLPQFHICCCLLCPPYM